jgi:hypothetical protein
MLNINKKKTATFVAILAVTIMLTSTVFTPTVDATTRYFHTWVYVATSAPASGTGVGEQMLIVAWTAEMPPDTGEISHVVDSPTGRAGWYGMQIQVWDPDNETEILDMPFSDPVGANYITYVPEKLGTYRVQAIFPETDEAPLLQETTMSTVKQSAL